LIAAKNTTIAWQWWCLSHTLLTLPASLISFPENTDIDRQSVLRRFYLHFPTVYRVYNTATKSDGEISSPYLQ